jgi:tRNA-splicing ligase RtcB
MKEDLTDFFMNHILTITCFWPLLGGVIILFFRKQAKKAARSRNLRDEFEEMGIQVRASSFATVAEEIPEAYKDVADVVDVVHGAGIGRKVVRLKPLGVLKG